MENGECMSGLELGAPMRALLPIIVALLSGPSLAAPLAGCEQLPKPSVSVKLLESPVSFDLASSYRELTSRVGDKARPGWQVLGLTRANAIARFSLQMPSLSNDQYECASPQITLTLAMQPLVVHVGKEFPKGSCAHKEILEHEMRHVKAYQAHLEKLQKIFEEALTRRYATATAWRGATGSLYERLSGELNEHWTTAITREFDRVEGPQRLIDTPEEYARIAAACGGEVQTMMK